MLCGGSYGGEPPVDEPSSPPNVTLTCSAGLHFLGVGRWGLLYVAAPSRVPVSPLELRTSSPDCLFGTSEGPHNSTTRTLSLSERHNRIIAVDQSSQPTRYGHSLAPSRDTERGERLVDGIWFASRRSGRLQFPREGKAEMRLST